MLNVGFLNAYTRPGLSCVCSTFTANGAPALVTFVRADYHGSGLPKAHWGIMTQRFFFTQLHAAITARSSRVSWCTKRPFLGVLKFSAFLSFINASWSGRTFADIHLFSEFAFIGGVSGLGVLSIGAGFVTSKIPLIILRALCGIAASMTIPSALTLLVNVFTEPEEQARAIGVFGGCGAVGNGEYLLS